MDYLYVRQRLEAFAARLRRAAGPEDPGGGSRFDRADRTGLSAMNTLGAGRR
jgi:hypothetical protein